jgi:hypothetical protein
LIEACSAAVSVVGADGKAMELPSTGWDHFRGQGPDRGG